MRVLAITFLILVGLYLLGRLVVWFVMWLTPWLDSAPYEEGIADKSLPDDKM